MKSLTNLVLSLSLAAGIAGCKRDYSFLGQRDAAGDISQRYDLGADIQSAADVDSDRERKYDFGKDVALMDLGLDAVARDLGRDAPEADGRRVDGAVVDGILPDRYVDVLQRYDAARLDAPAGDTYSPDAGVIDAARADRPIIIFPDAEVPDLYADGRADMLPDIGTDLPVDLGADLPPDLGADVGINPCPGEAPLNTLQAGVCAGSRNSCGPTGWQDDYRSVIGYEVNEVSCDGLNNDCDELVDILVMIDDFNRPDQEGLGNNALGNPWTNNNDLNAWNIEGNMAVNSIVETGGSRPAVSSDIGHRTSFDMYVKFKLSEVNNVGSGALLYVVNSRAGATDDGLALRIAINGPSEHRIYRRGVNLAIGILELQANTWYNLQFSFNNSRLGAKIWEDGTPKPAEYLMSGPTVDVDATMGYTKLSGFLDTGVSLTTTVDYIAEGCE